MHSVDFILEALEDEVALGVLELTDLLFLLQLVVLHGGRDVVGVCIVFGVEHVRAQVQDHLLVVALVIAFAHLLHAEDFHELGNSVHEAKLLDTLREPLFTEVAQTNQEVDQNRVRKFVLGL